MAVSVLGVAAAADRVEELQSRFDREPHAVSKLKILEKLGEAQFASATEAETKADYSAVGLIFEKYRDNLRAAFDLLKQQESNVDKHSQGYRHLELQARRALREVDDILITVPAELRPPLELVRDDIIHIDDELIRLLFPRRTPEKNAPAAGTKP